MQECQSSSGSLFGGEGTPATPLVENVTKSGDPVGIQPLTSEDRQAKGMETKLKFIEETHQYIREYIRLADQKSAFFFAGFTAVLAYLHQIGATNRWLCSPAGRGAIEVVSFIATIGLCLSSTFCVFVVIPRLKGEKKGVLFFAAIQNYQDRDEYAVEVINAELTEICRAKLHHVYEMSGVCQNKYKMLHFGLFAGAVGAVASLICMVLIS
jgi:hypothetical protein